MITMTNFINSIPESAGWVAVGVLMTLAFIAFCVICKVLVEVWREQREERKFITFYEEEE